MTTLRRKPWIACFPIALCVLGGSPAGAQRAQQQPSIQWTRQEILDAVTPVRAGQKLTPKSWPGGARVAVCFSFDVDNEALSLVRGNVAPVELSAREFGAMTGLPGVLDLLKRQAIPASFYIPAAGGMLHPQMIERILEPGVHARENAYEVFSEEEQQKAARNSAFTISTREELREPYFMEAFVELRRR